MRGADLTDAGSRPRESDEKRLARLERARILRRPSRELPRQILTQPPPSPRRGGSALAALLAERAEDRP